MLRDYGFVEALPQRWKFMRNRIVFDLDENESGELEIEWHFKPEGTTKDAAKSWLQDEITRLTEVQRSDGNSDLGEVPLHEFNTINAFIKANVLAMTNALQSLQEGHDKDEL